MEALVLRATFHVLTGNSEDALQDLNEVINMNDANIKVSCGRKICSVEMNKLKQLRRFVALHRG